MFDLEFKRLRIDNWSNQSQDGNEQKFKSSHGYQVVLVVKNPPANAGDARDKGSVPRWGRSPGGGHGNPHQYSCLENPMDRGAWWAIESTALHRVGHNWNYLACTQAFTCVWNISFVSLGRRSLSMPCKYRRDKNIIPNFYSGVWNYQHSITLGSKFQNMSMTHSSFTNFVFSS